MYTLKEIDEVVEKGLYSLNWEGNPGELYEPIEYLVSIGGKRLRPKMAIMCYNLFSEKIDTSIVYPALALEIFHGFTLIHDDIMDGASLRRNQPTVHKKWNNNIAILSGDVMCIKSYQLIGYAPEKYLKKVLKLFSDTAAQVCEGQQYDMNFETLPFITNDEYLEMIGLKTAVLIACSAKLGAIISGASPEAAGALYNYGYQLGLAFQIKDDYLDSFGDTAVFGKTIGGDIMSNKKTWLLVESMKRAQGNDEAELNSLLSSKNQDQKGKISKVLALYEKLGIKTAAEEAIGEYHEKAQKALVPEYFTGKQRERLMEFANLLLNREK
ncbi:MAG: polyprenyl synthetase family protein [Bacteroidales bacterium]|jgi:geranylgeranyl diphosphate synthase type II|nr:polyprenyl synthetase family protein [Bacteroidales bacterium]MDD2280557.1 polyprenyl synthetase family protein [Bacteroidales bacterium]MDD4491410.1 polyprenyl synthetase family protein [Bacteroidales bacterium]HPS96136.1 polyprenyl synthetase family protein [Bacteroidales bacterium]